MQERDTLDQAMREILERLAAPFPDEAIGIRPAIWCRACKLQDIECTEHTVAECGTCGATVTTAHDDVEYIGHAWIRERFSEVDPRWNWEPYAHDERGLPVFDKNGGLWMRVTIGGKTMIGYGDAPGATGGNAVKEAIGDGFRNAGQNFRTALDMWKRRRPLRLVEPSKPQLTDEQRAARLRDEIRRHGHRKGKKFGQTVGAFNAWAEYKHEFREAPADVLAAYLDHLKAS